MGNDRDPQARLIVYLHGFRSSPNSSKAKLTAEAVQVQIDKGKAIDWFCPQLPPSPQLAMDNVIQRIERSTAPHLTVIGSSLGGFYATYLGERYAQRHCKVILLNPAVRAARELAPYVGTLTTYDSDEPFEWRADYVEQLKAQQIEQITKPERYFLIAAKGDELLDWHEMVAHYPGAKQLVLEGSDHSLSDYPDYLKEVLQFACF